jgi:hypothetical protein
VASTRVKRACWPLVWGITESLASWSRSATGYFVLVCLCFSVLVTCTKAELERIPAEQTYRDDKLEITGSFCTSEPDTLVFPLRLLFIVDTSSSMAVVDPPDPITGETNRERAVRETWQRLMSEAQEGVEVGIIRFSAEAGSTVAITDENGLPQGYFTDDSNRLLEGTAALRETNRTTNYINALGEAYYQIRTELLVSDLESLPLSKYIVIFLSDGVPNLDSSEARDTSRDRILESVKALVELTNTFRVGDFSFHTAFLASGVSTIDEEAQDLLRAMARIGNGNFRNFPTGEELNFLFAELTVLRRVFTLERLGAFNLNVVLDQSQMPPPPQPEVEADAGMDAGDVDEQVDPEPDVVDEPEENDAGFDAAEPEPEPEPPRLVYFIDHTRSGYPECGDFLIDTDGDGLADLVEDEIGTNPFDRDSDGDGLSDYLEWRFRESGLNPLDPSDSQCYIPAPCMDSTGSGTCDCVLDSNGDGVCDCVSDPDLPCADASGRDCIDADGDGLCDCLDLNGDGRCDYTDSTGDGLNDCEEVFFGTSQKGVDTDGDGFPDVVELRFRTDALRSDANDDLDMDSVPNGLELLANTNPRCNDSRVRSRTAYRYQLAQLEKQGKQSCYDFSVSNITLVPTRPNPNARHPGNGWNRILLYAGEVPFDDPTASGRFRFACVMANYQPDGDYKNPPSGRVHLTEENFVTVKEFDPDVHCVWP